MLIRARGGRAKSKESGSVGWGAEVEALAEDWSEEGRRGQGRRLVVCCDVESVIRKGPGCGF